MAIPRKTGVCREGRTRVGDLANRFGADFLQIDSEVALTFSGIALTTRDEEKRRRVTRAARKAYDTIMRLRKDVVLGDAEGDKLDFNLLRLKSELEFLDQSI